MLTQQFRSVTMYAKIGPQSSVLNQRERLGSGVLQLLANYPCTNSCIAAQVIPAAILGGVLAQIAKMLLDTALRNFFKILWILLNFFKILWRNCWQTHTPCTSLLDVLICHPTLMGCWWCGFVLFCLFSCHARSFRSFLLSAGEADRVPVGRRKALTKSNPSKM